MVYMTVLIGKSKSAKDKTRAELGLVQYLNMRFFRSDEMQCHARSYATTSEALASGEETFYHKMLEDPDVLNLEAWQQIIIFEGLRRNMCLKKSAAINIPQEVGRECLKFTGR